MANVIKHTTLHDMSNVENTPIALFDIALLVKYLM